MKVVDGGGEVGQEGQQQPILQSSSDLGANQGPRSKALNGEARIVLQNAPLDRLPSRKAASSGPHHIHCIFRTRIDLTSLS